MFIVLLTLEIIQKGCDCKDNKQNYYFENATLLIWLITLFWLINYLYKYIGHTYFIIQDKTFKK